jgi:hypothetical protein
MSSLAIITVIGLAVLAVMTVIFIRVRRKDQIGAILEKRRPGSKVVSRADYVEGTEKIPVALALAADAIYYENLDLQASFDLVRIDEVEYSEDLITGKEIDPACQVLRLRSHGTTFEFLIDKTEAPKWQAALPTRTIGVTPPQVM